MATLYFPNGQQIKNVHHIIFDKDGTLFDIHRYWCSMIKLRAQSLADKFNNKVLYQALCDAMGVDKSGKKLKPEGPVGIKSRKIITQVISDTLRKFGIVYSPEEVEKTFKEIDIISQERLEDFLETLPGVFEFLLNCQKNAIKMSIATNDITERAEKALRLKKMDHYFSAICGGDSVENTKPARDIADLILEKIQSTREESVMVGDHTVDLMMAINAQINASVGVTTGLLNKSKLAESTDFITDDLSKIKIISDEN